MTPKILRRNANATIGVHMRLSVLNLLSIGAIWYVA